MNERKNLGRTSIERGSHNKWMRTCSRSGLYRKLLQFGSVCMNR
jgi:hypothetical protein